MATLAVEDRTALTDALRRLLADRCTEADVRRTLIIDYNASTEARSLLSAG